MHLWAHVHMYTLQNCVVCCFVVVVGAKGQGPMCTHTHTHKTKTKQNKTKQKLLELKFENNEQLCLVVKASISVQQRL